MLMFNFRRKGRERSIVKNKIFIKKRTVIGTRELHEYKTISFDSMRV